jgi:predicted GNAT family N-acyltransferase
MPVTVTITETPTERELCYAIRKAVFVEEQAVPLELELDEYDDIATHFLLRDGDMPQATARLLDKHGLAKIGRVAVLKEVRGRGLGLALMQAVLAEARRRGFTESVLDSQTYAIPFYARVGFVAEGEEFDDAGIPHFLMRRRL